MNLTAKNTTAELVRLNSQGYDSNGRYWGVGEKLYRLDAKSLGTTLVNAYGHACQPLYTRAKSAKDAREAAMEVFVQVESEENAKAL